MHITMARRYISRTTNHPTLTTGGRKFALPETCRLQGWHISGLVTFLQGPVTALTPLPSARGGRGVRRLTGSDAPPGLGQLPLSLGSRPASTGIRLPCRQLYPLSGEPAACAVLTVRSPCRMRGGSASKTPSPTIGAHLPGPAMKINDNQ